MKSYNGQKIDLPTHRQHLKNNLLGDYDRLSQKSRKPFLLNNWKTALAGFTVVIILAIGSLNLPFLSRTSEQKVSAKEIVEKAKNHYYEKTLSEEKTTPLPEIYESTEIWDYFPENDQIVIDEFDEFGFFEVLDDYEDELFAANFVEPKGEQAFYQVEFMDEGHKIQLLLNPDDYEIMQIDIFDETADSPGTFKHRFSQQWQ